MDLYFSFVLSLPLSEQKQHDSHTHTYISKMSPIGIDKTILEFTNQKKSKTGFFPKTKHFFEFFFIFCFKHKQKPKQNPQNDMYYLHDGCMYYCRERYVTQPIYIYRGRIRIRRIYI